MTARAPGPPASVLAAVIRADPAHPYDATNLAQRRIAWFSATGPPVLPSLITDGVFMPQYALLDANVEITGSLTVDQAFIYQDQALAVSAGLPGGGIFTVTNTTGSPSAANAQFFAQSAGDKEIGVRVTGDAADRLLVDSSGKLSWGSGAGAADLDLYRSASGVLKTDNSLQVVTGLGVGASPPAAGASFVGSASAQLVYIEQDGSSGHGLTVNLAGTGGTTQAAVNAVSANSAFSCVEVTGTETAHGTVKIAHKGYADGSDSAAAAISVDLQTTSGGVTGTAAQGIFLTSTTDAAPTGNPFTVRYNSLDQFVIKSTGRVAFGNIAIGHTPAGQLEIAQMDTSTIGVVMTAIASGTDMVNLKDSGGTLRFQVNNSGSLISRASSFFTSPVAFGTTSSDAGGGGGGVITLCHNTDPTTNPASGHVILYCDVSGNLLARTSAGNVRTVAAV